MRICPLASKESTGISPPGESWIVSDESHNDQDVQIDRTQRLITVTRSIHCQSIATRRCLLSLSFRISGHIRCRRASVAFIVLRCGKRSLSYQHQFMKTVKASHAWRHHPCTTFFVEHLRTSRSLLQPPNTIGHAHSSTSSQLFAPPLSEAPFFHHVVLRAWTPIAQFFFGQNIGLPPACLVPFAFFCFGCPIAICTCSSTTDCVTIV